MLPGWQGASAWESRPGRGPPGVPSARDPQPFIFIDLGSRSGTRAAISKTVLEYQTAFAVTPASQFENLSFIWL